MCRNTPAEQGKPNNRLVSDILKEYYLEAGKDTYQKKRYSNFARKLGLIWDNNGFTNLNQKMGTYLTDMANFNLMLTIVGAGGLTYEAHKARFALTELRYFSDDEMKKHLNLFFKNLHTKIQSE